MIMGAVALALLVSLAFVATRGGDGAMGFLYTDLDPTAAQAIAEKLEAQGVDYRLSADGSSILAPQEKLAELRMSLAGEKLGGPIGYDVLDQEDSFGVSSSRAKMNETRAVEGELSRSIQSLQAVAAARVHIVMPERAMFAAEARKATAAVTVKTRGRLPAETVQAIRYLVSSSVPELSPEAVSVVDQSGALLARAGDSETMASTDADERQAAVETRLRDEIEALLSPIVGQGKVRAEVSAEINRDAFREEANIYDPDIQVIARQVMVESGNQDQETGPAPAGVTVGNELPENVGQPAQPGESRSSAANQTSEDTTYQNSSRRTVTVRGPGEVKRLSVAVMVDGGEKGLDDDMIQRLTRLVENAIGYDTERGDSVVVESMAFAPVDDLAESEGGLFSLISMDRIFGLLQLLIIAVAGLVALRMLKPKPAAESTMQDGGVLNAENDPEMLALAQRAADGDEEAMHQLEERQAENGHPALDQEIALAQVDGRIKVSALNKIGETISASPPEAVSVIRQWMNA
ncbi:flagellar basal-body MS-ring/collar protein FliF [Stakelama tenebrarum]|nr:flagellar basal-body MS-ring/collar protein FliF [Sphingosinithalassobacter tenebrarum]